MSRNKRMGSQDSPTSQAILDAVEKILRDEGYAAATTRRIAQEAGVTQQLVYYYFRTIDELLLAAWKRRTARGLDRLYADLSSDKPIKAMWADYANAHDARLTFEYMALANRLNGIKEETTRFLDKARRLQAEAIEKAYEVKGIAREPVSPAAAAFLMQAASLMLCRESDSGVTFGHDDVRALVDWALSRFD